MLFLRVFWTFLEIGAKDMARNAYLDRTNHYLQLLYWSSVPKNYGFRAKVRQSQFLGPKRAQACLGRHPAKNFLRFLRYSARSQFRPVRTTFVRPLLAEKKFKIFLEIFISNFLSKIRVFGHFLDCFCLDLAENRYVDSTNHYLQLFY